MEENPLPQTDATDVTEANDITSLNDIFDKVFVINLSRDTTKLADMTTRLNGLNVKFTRFDAVLGKEVSKDILKRELTPWCQNFCPAATVGCALSHKGIWREIVKQNLESAVIFEDDCIFNPSFYSTLSKAVKDLPKDWDILYLGCIAGCYKNRAELSTFDSIFLKALGRDTEPIVVSENLYRPTLPLAAHAYVLSQKGARTLLKRIPKVGFHIDTAMASHCDKMQVFAVHPNIVTQDTSDSGMATFKPVLLTNLAKHVEIDDRGRDLGWTMSEPVAQVSGEPINGWHFFLFITGLFIGAVVCDITLAITLLGLYFIIEAIFEYRATRKLSGIGSGILFIIFFTMGYMISRQITPAKVEN